MRCRSGRTSHNTTQSSMQELARIEQRAKSRLRKNKDYTNLVCQLSNTLSREPSPGLPRNPVKLISISTLTRSLREDQGVCEQVQRERGEESFEEEEVLVHFNNPMLQTCLDLSPEAIVNLRKIDASQWRPKQKEKMHHV